MIALHLNAGNDVNGNPRRCYLVIDNRGHTRAALDEGYSGNAVVTKWAKRHRVKVHLAGQVAITPAQYRNLVKLESEGAWRF